jgi:hypothetical protein
MKKNIVIMTSALLLGMLSSCTMTLSAVNGADQKFDATVTIIPVEEDSKK